MIKNIEKLINNFQGKVSLYATDEYSNEIKINENDIVETASCIKTFILVEYYNQIMKGKISRDDKLVYKYNEDYVSNGSGIIQYLDDGLTLSSKNMVILMIIVSDNIATNKIIEYLGYENINNTIKELGFNNTKLLCKSLNFDKYSKIGETTAYEYALLFKKIKNNEILNSNLCEEIIQILSTQTSNDMLVKKLSKKYLDEKGNKDSFINYIASKSGGLGGENKEIITCRNDGGIISTKYGSYIISIFIYNFSDYYFYRDNPSILLGSEINKIIFENFEINKGKFNNK